MKKSASKIFLYLFFLTPFLAPMITNLFIYLFLSEVWLVSSSSLFLITIMETFLFLPILILFFIEKELIRFTPIILKTTVNTLLFVGVVVFFSFATVEIEKSPFFKTLMYVNIFWVALNYIAFEVLNRK